MISTSNSVTGNTFKYLAKLPKLNYLIFDDLGSLEFNNVKELGKIKTLKNLQLADMYLKDPSQWSEVSKVASINSFSCLKTNISDEAIFKIIEKLKLTSLNISECPNLSDRAFETIANSQVANLAVNYNRISQSKIEILARSSRLKVLYLIGCDLTDDHISMLSKFKNIEYLNLAENNRISVSKREELKKLLSAKIVF